MLNTDLDKIVGITEVVEKFWIIWNQYFGQLFFEGKSRFSKTSRRVFSEAQQASQQCDGVQVAFSKQIKRYMNTEIKKNDDTKQKENSSNRLIEYAQAQRKQGRKHGYPSRVRVGRGPIWGH